MVTGLLNEVGATDGWFTATATVAVPATFGQPFPVGVLVVIVRVTLPFVIAGTVAGV
jgi:hypothetical protein